jgi:hypothetical protein
MSSKVLIAVLLLAVAVIGSEVGLMLLRVGSFFAFPVSLFLASVLLFGRKSPHAAFSLSPAPFPVTHLFLSRLSLMFKTFHCCVFVASCCGFLFILFF